MCVDENAKPIQENPFYELGQKMREARMKKGWTVREAAENMFYGAVAYGRFERGLEKAPDDILQTLGIEA